jgi:hypothetical protein
MIICGDATRPCLRRYKQINEYESYLNDNGIAETRLEAIAKKHLEDVQHITWFVSEIPLKS